MNKKIISSLLLIILLFSTVMLVYASTLYEYYNTGDNTNNNIYGVIWQAMTFTTGAIGHTITSVKLKMYRIGLPSILTVSIRETDVNGHPTGADKTSGTINANDFTENTNGLWYEITLTEYTLTVSKKYAIVCRAIEGDSSKKVSWRMYYNGGYTGGNGEESSNSGGSWTTYLYWDYMFEIWGNSFNPTNDYLALDLTGSEYKGIKTLLPLKQDYKIVYKCSDINGVTDITYAEIRLDYINKNVILRVTRGAGDTWTFSEQSDPSNYVTLNVASSTHSTSGTQKTFNFLIKINWNWGDSSETIGIRAYVIDSTSLSDIDDYSNIFGVEAHIKAYSLAVNDYRCNPSQTLTFSGYWYYDGTSIYPPNNDYQIKVKLSGVQKGSTDTTLVSGYFNINDVNAESIINNYSYTIEATYMDSAGSFNSVIVDRLQVVLFSSNYNPIIDNYVKISWVITREYDNSGVSSFIIDISKDNVLWLDDETLNYGYDISIIEIVIRYNCTSVTDNIYNLNTFTTNYIDVSWEAIEEQVIPLTYVYNKIVSDLTVVNVTIKCVYDNGISKIAFSLNNVTYTNETLITSNPFTKNILSLNYTTFYARLELNKTSIITPELISLIYTQITEPPVESNISGILIAIFILVIAFVIFMVYFRRH